MTNQEIWTKRFTDIVAGAKADAAMIKDFIDGDLGLCAERVNRFDIGHAKVLAEKLHAVVSLIYHLKEG